MALVKKTKSNGRVSEMEEDEDLAYTIDLMELPNEMLIHIAGFLPTVRDVLSFAGVNKRLDHVLSLNMPTTGLELAKRDPAYEMFHPGFRALEDNMTPRRLAAAMAGIPGMAVIHIERAQQLDYLLSFIKQNVPRHKCKLLNVDIQESYYTRDMDGYILELAELGVKFHGKFPYCRTLQDYNLEIFGVFASLDLNNCKDVTDVSALGNVHTLDLHNCKNITDVSALNKVYKLNLSNTKVADVSALGNVHTLDLHSCKNITDVSALGSVHTLDLCYTNVTDVSALGNVHNLNLSGTKVVDVSALGNVHTLDLSNTKVVDVSALGNVHTLNLICSFDITDVSALTNVAELTLPDGNKIFK